MRGWAVHFPVHAGKIVPGGIGSGGLTVMLKEEEEGEVH